MWCCVDVLCCCVFVYYVVNVWLFGCVCVVCCCVVVSFVVLLFRVLCLLVCCVVFGVYACVSLCVCAWLFV